MKAKDILKGTKARREIVLRFGEEEVPVDVRLLTGFERLMVLEQADATAKKRGVEKPAEGHPIYDYLVMVHTVAIGVIDHDSPEDKPETYFSNADEILSMPDVTPDHVTYLYEQVQRYADDCGHRHAKLSDAEAMAKIVEIATSEDDRPFERLRPSALVSLLRFSARQWWLSLTSNSGSISVSAPTGKKKSSKRRPSRQADETQGS